MMKSMKSTRLRTAQPALDNLKNLERDLASDITHIQDININKDSPQRAPALDLSTVATTAPPETPAPNPPTRIFGLQDAPTYYPTEKEFLEPLKYIESIRAEAEQAGICKIIPPKGWKPPFSLDTEVRTHTKKEDKLGNPTLTSHPSILPVITLTNTNTNTTSHGWLPFYPSPMTKVSTYKPRRHIPRTHRHNHHISPTSHVISHLTPSFPKKKLSDSFSALAIMRLLPTFFFFLSFCWLYTLLFFFFPFCRVSHMYSADTTTTTKLRQVVVLPFFFSGWIYVMDIGVLSTRHVTDMDMNINMTIGFPCF